MAKSRPMNGGKARRIGVGVLVLALVVGVLGLLRLRGDDGVSSCAPTDAVVATNRSFDPDVELQESPDGLSQVVLWTADGRSTVLLRDEVLTEPDASPDGGSLVVVRADGDYESAGPGATDLWVLTVDGEVTSKLTTGSSADSPDWSPLGDQIVYSEYVDGNFELRTIRSDGTDSPELLLPSGGANRLAPAWSPDATQVAFVKRISPQPNGAGGVSEVWLVGADGQAPRRLADAPGGAKAPDAPDAQSIAWSPDGSQLLVSSLAGDNGRVDLIDVDSGSSRKLADGATSATWTDDGTGVFYFTKDGAEERPLWRLADGSIAGGRLERDRFIGDDSTYLDPYFGTSTVPCP